MKRIIIPPIVMLLSLVPGVVGAEIGRYKWRWLHRYF